MERVCGGAFCGGGKALPKGAQGREGGVDFGRRTLLAQGHPDRSRLRAHQRPLLDRLPSPLAQRAHLPHVDSRVSARPSASALLVVQAAKGRCATRIPFPAISTHTPSRYSPSIFSIGAGRIACAKLSRMIKPGFEDERVTSSRRR